MLRSWGALAVFRASLELGWLSRAGMVLRKKESQTSVGHSLVDFICSVLTLCARYCAGQQRHGWFQVLEADLQQVVLCTTGLQAGQLSKGTWDLPSHLPTSVASSEASHLPCGTGLIPTEAPCSGQPSKSRTFISASNQVNAAYIN